MNNGDLLKSNMDILTFYIAHKLYNKILFILTGIIFCFISLSKTLVLGHRVTRTLESNLFWVYFIANFSTDQDCIKCSTLICIPMFGNQFVKT